MRARHGGRRGRSVQSGITCASTCTPRTLGLHAGQRLGIPVPGPPSSLSLHGQRDAKKRQAAPPTNGPIARGEDAARLPASSDARERPGSRMGRFQLTSELPSRPDDQRAVGPSGIRDPTCTCKIQCHAANLSDRGVPLRCPWQKTRKSQAQAFRNVFDASPETALGNKHEGRQRSNE
jgi:hypothetical protein